jgi:hypothetical protein
MEVVEDVAFTYSNGDTYKARVRQRAFQPAGARRAHRRPPRTAPPQPAPLTLHASCAPPPQQGQATGSSRHGRGVHTCSNGDYYGAPTRRARVALAGVAAASGSS